MGAFLPYIFAPVRLLIICKDTAGSMATAAMECHGRIQTGEKSDSGKVAQVAFVSGHTTFVDTSEQHQY